MSLILGSEFLNEEAQKLFSEFVKTGIFLNDLQYRYGFSKLETGYGFSKLETGLAKVDVWCDYAVRNYSGKEVKYAPKLQIEKSESPEIISLSCDSFDENSKYVLNGEEIVRQHEREDVISVVGKLVTLRNETKKDYNPYHVSWHYSIIRPIKDNDLICFGILTIGVQVKAQYDTKQFRVAIDEKEYRLAKVDDFTWKSIDGNSLFVPQQHIRTRWWPVQ